VERIYDTKAELLFLLTLFCGIHNEDFFGETIDIHKIEYYKKKEVPSNSRFHLFYL